MVEKYGAIIRHYRSDGVLCEGCITFDGEWQRKNNATGNYPTPLWTVECWEPLTVSPSILCKAPVYDAEGKHTGTCDDHGFIRQGKWVKA